MKRHRLAVGIVCWVLLSPGICEAYCIAPAPAHPDCHQVAPTEGEPAPAPHSELECCERAVLVGAATGQVPLPNSLSHRVADDPQPEQKAASDRVPEPPDLPNSPYLQVTPPRLVYLG